MKVRLFLRALFAIIIAVLVAIDQLSKWLAEAYLPLHEAVSIIPFFSLYLTYNEGVAFSMLEDLGKWGLVAMSLVITLFMLFLWSRTRIDHKLAQFGFAFVIAGAIGNLIDRTLYGHVIGYFLFHTQTWAFAVFNVADSFITVGAAGIILQELLEWKNSGHADNSNAKGDSNG